GPSQGYHGAQGRRGGADDQIPTWWYLNCQQLLILLLAKELVNNYLIRNKEGNDRKSSGVERNTY
ncbi:hypothetical protein ACJX0J_012341, partial [Zea mays]